jgi:hypothetical protein
MIGMKTFKDIDERMAAGAERRLAALLAPLRMTCDLSAHGRSPAMPPAMLEVGLPGALFTRKSKFISADLC